MSVSINTYNFFWSYNSPSFGIYIDAANTPKVYAINKYGINTFSSFTSSVNFQSQSWYNTVFSTKYDGTYTTMSMYINGIYEINNIVTGSQSFGLVSDVTIGAGSNDTLGSFPFNGYVSHVKIYNRTLSDEEVRRNFNALRSRYNI